MQTGNLTPRSNNTIDEMRFTGNFGQPDGFDSVLVASVRKSGDACLTLTYCMDVGDREERIWSIMLTNEQRLVLAKLLNEYKPTLYERTGEQI